MPSMNENPYAGLYDELPDVDAYLARINYTGSKEPTLETLKGLMWAHLTNVPFENEELISQEKQASLNVKDLYDKIVVRRRGGYCFEQNGLFYKLLKALGFDVYNVGVRIRVGRPWLPLVAHRGLIVTIEGKRYYADVGFGGPAPVTPVEIDNQEWQKSGSRYYCGEICGPRIHINIKSEETGEGILFDFSAEPWDEIDFIAPNAMMSAFEGQAFRANPMISMLSDDGHKSLSRDMYKEVKNGVLTETKIETEEDFKKIMLEKFGLK